MEIAMLIIGLLLGGCVSFCILGCMQIKRINDYEDARYAGSVPKREPKQNKQ